MIQKPRGKKKASKSTKPVKKFTSVERAIGNSGKAIDEAYDRGFNDGYSKGLEDGGLDESK